MEKERKLTEIELREKRLELDNDVLQVEQLKEKLKWQEQNKKDKVPERDANLQLRAITLDIEKGGPMERLEIQINQTNDEIERMSHNIKVIKKIIRTGKEVYEEPTKEDFEKLKLERSLLKNGKEGKN